MKEIKEVEVSEDKVKLVIVDVDRWGYIRKRQQMTFRRRQFEAALRTADMTVPWQQVAR